MAHPEQALSVKQAQVIASQLQDLFAGNSFYYRDQTGLNISAMQQLLNLALINIKGRNLKDFTASDLEPIVVNGVFDRRTEAVVRKIQRAFSIGLEDGTLVEVGPGTKERGLSPDGIVGPRTSAVLYKLAGGTFGPGVESFNTFKSITGGIWDTSQVVNPFLASDLSIPKNLRTLSPERFELIRKEAESINLPPEWYLATLLYESGLKPKARNQFSGFTGLLQMSNDNAVNYYGHLGVKSSRDIARLSFEEQLPGVTHYFRDQLRSKRIQTFEDLYLSVLYPKGIGMAMSDSLFSLKSRWSREVAAYRQNAQLDRDGDQVVTVAEATFGARKVLEKLSAPSNINYSGTE